MSKCKYESHVKPRFNEIKEWVAGGATQVQIAKSLGISERSLRDYLKEHTEFADLYKSGQIDLVTELRGVLIKKAKGFQYTEVEIIENEDGTTKKRTVTKTALPDVAALNLALKNYDKDNWANDPQMLKLKKEELKFKKDNAELIHW